jgi:hypothetical protein
MSDILPRIYQIDLAVGNTTDVTSSKPIAGGRPFRMQRN